jgi:hypothetical protein
MTTDGIASRAQLIASSTIALIRSAAGRKGQVFSGRSTERAAANAKAKAMTLSTFMPSPLQAAHQMPERSVPTRGAVEGASDAARCPEGRHHLLRMICLQP